MVDAKDSLQQFLDQQEQVENDGFFISDNESANWALRKIKEYTDIKTANNALAISETEKIEVWNKKENDKAQASIDYFQGLLGAYALKQRQANPKFKSLKLPNGKIKFVSPGAKYVYNDKEIVEYLKKTDRLDLVNTKTTEEPKKNEIKKLFIAQGNRLIDPDTGEFVEGVTVEKPEDVFKVEVNDDGKE